MSESKWVVEELWALALSLPEACQDSHFGRPDLRVRSKIFATLPEDGSSISLKTTPIGLDMLLRDDPVTYHDAWGGRWVRVDLRRAAPDDVRELLIEAYCLAAPRKLALQARSALERGSPPARNEPPPGFD